MWDVLLHGPKKKPALGGRGKGHLRARVGRSQKNSACISIPGRSETEGSRWGSERGAQDRMTLSPKWWEENNGSPLIEYGYGRPDKGKSGWAGSTSKKTSVPTARVSREFRKEN